MRKHCHQISLFLSYELINYKLSAISSKVCPCSSQINSMFLAILIGDCHDSYGHKHRCVTGAIYNYTMQLKLANANASSELKCKHL